MVGNNISSLPNFIVYGLFLVVYVALGVNTELVFAQNDKWLNWDDPDKQFTLQYPSDWTISPRENRFGEYDIGFYIGGDFAKLTNLTTLTIDVSNVSSSADLKETMKATVEDAITNPNNALKKIRLFEGPEFTKYSISGKPAGSATWVYDADYPSDGRNAYQLIGSIVNDKLIQINYNSPTEYFDSYLPEIEKVIQSIKVK